MPRSFAKTQERIKQAAAIYRAGVKVLGNKRVLRMGIHATAQADNLDGLPQSKAFCDTHGMFLSIAPLAPVGGGLEIGHLQVPEKVRDAAAGVGHNSIILSHTSRTEVGREVCGTCLYGLNVGYDGNVLFDAHAGYEIGGILGNVRIDSLEVLIARQRKFAPRMFSKIEGFCPIRDAKWPQFMREVLENPAAYLKKWHLIRLQKWWAAWIPFSLG